MNNLGLKILSLFVATLLYFFVSSESNMSEIQFAVKIELKNLAEDRIVIHPENREVMVTVKGPSFEVLRIASSPPVLRVNVPDDVGNRYVAPLNNVELALPPYIQVVNIVPSEIEFIFDTRVTKTLHVKVPTIGGPPENVKVETVRVNPETVRVDGPETELNTVEAIETFPLDIREVRNNLSRTLALKVPGKLSKLSADQVEVDLEVSMVQEEKELRAVPIEIRSTHPGSYSILPSVANLKVTGPVEAVRTLTKDGVVPYVKIPPGFEATPPKKREKAKILVDLPRGVSVVSLDPASVEIVKSSVNEGKRKAG